MSGKRSASDASASKKKRHKVDFEALLADMPKEEDKEQAKDLIYQGFDGMAEAVKAAYPVCSPIAPPDTARIGVYAKGMSVCIVKPGCRIFDQNIRKVKDRAGYKWAGRKFNIGIGRPAVVVDHISHHGVRYITHVVRPEGGDAVLMVPPEALGPSVWKGQLVYILTPKNRLDTKKQVRDLYKAAVKDSEWATQSDVRELRTARVIAVTFNDPTTYCLLRLEPPGLPDAKYCVFPVTSINDTAQWSRTLPTSLHHIPSTSTVVDHTSSAPVLAADAGTISHTVTRPVRGQLEQAANKYQVLYYPPGSSFLTDHGTAYGVTYGSANMTHQELQDANAADTLL